MLLFYLNCNYKTLKSSYNASFCVEIALGQNVRLCTITGQNICGQNVLVKTSMAKTSVHHTFNLRLQALPHMPILGSSNSAAHNNLMSKILINGDTIFLWSRKHCGKTRNCLSFPAVFKSCLLLIC